MSLELIELLHKSKLSTGSLDPNKFEKIKYFYFI